MQPRLYLDDCAYSKELYRLLTRSGWDVQVPVDVQLTGANDPVHMHHARLSGRVLVTKNPGDFLALHAHDTHHHGIIAIYQDNSTRDMSPAAIVRAIANVVRILDENGQPLEGRFINLNEWQF